MSLFHKYFYNNKRRKLCFGDRVAVLNDILYEYEGTTMSVSEHYIIAIKWLPPRIFLLTRH